MQRALQPSQRMAETNSKILNTGHPIYYLWNKLNNRENNESLTSNPKRTAVYIDIIPVDKVKTIFVN